MNEETQKPEVPAAPEAPKETVVQDVENIGKDTVEDTEEAIHFVESEPLTVAEHVEHAFESLRGWLVELLGDHHGVHSTIDDAKKAIAAHVPVEQATTAASTQDATQPVAPTTSTPESK